MKEVAFGAVPQIGGLAPDFELPALIGGVKKKFRLSEHHGRQNLLLAFYPLNWEEVSARQMVQYQLQRDTFLARQTAVVGISVDSIMNTTAWEREIGPFDFIMCSDFWPHGEVARAYGVLRQQEPFAGASERAVFLVDKAGHIRFRKVYELGQVPKTHEAFELLRAS